MQPFRGVVGRVAPGHAPRRLVRPHDRHGLLHIRPLSRCAILAFPSFFGRSDTRCPISSVPERRLDCCEPHRDHADDQLEVGKPHCIPQCLPSHADAHCPVRARLHSAHHFDHESVALDHVLCADLFRQCQPRVRNGRRDQQDDHVPVRLFRRCLHDPCVLARVRLDGHVRSPEPVPVLGGV